MTPLTDDALVATLRRQADDAPPMLLDPDVVLLAGRRHRRRTLAVRSGAALAAAAAVVLGATQVSLPRDDRPAPVATRQDARPIGDDQVAELAAGVRAANRPVVVAGAPDGEVLELGELALPLLGDGAPDGPVLRVGRTTPASGGTADGDGDEHRVTFTQGVDGDVSSSWDVTWDGPAPDGTPYRASVEVGDGGVGVQPGTYVVGVVPTWLAAPRVLVDVVPLEPDGSAGDGGLLVEVPTFEAPSGDGLLYAAWVPHGAAVRTDREVVDRSGSSTLAGGVVFLGADGELVVGSSRCTGRVLGTCPQDMQERVAAQLELLAATPGTDAGAADAALQVTGAQDVVARTALAPEGVALLDLGVDSTGVDGQEARWFLEVSGAPPARTVAVSARTADGRVLGSGASTTTPESGDDPEYVAFSQDNRLAIGGLVPPGLEGATVEAVVGWGADAPTVPLRTFDVPGHDQQAWFALVEAPQSVAIDWPDVRVRATTPDGRVETVRVRGT